LALVLFSHTHAQARFLQQKFPDLNVEGGVYPAPPIMEFIGNIMAFVQIAAMAWMVMGADSFFGLLGFRQRPQWTYSVEQNSMQYALLLFLVLPQIINSFRQSGAFELILDDDKEIFSKLNAGRFPTQEELINGLQAAGLQLAS
jgi:selT/selW/selH-like putative selenoprotein